MTAGAVEARNLAGNVIVNAFLPQLQPPKSGLSIPSILEDMRVAHGHVAGRFKDNAIFRRASY